MEAKHLAVLLDMCRPAAQQSVPACSQGELLLGTCRGAARTAAQEGWYVKAAGCSLALSFGRRQKASRKEMYRLLLLMEDRCPGAPHFWAGRTMNAVREA